MQDNSDVKLMSTGWCSLFNYFKIIRTSATYGVSTHFTNALETKNFSPKKYLLSLKDHETISCV